MGKTKSIDLHIEEARNAAPSYPVDDAALRRTTSTATPSIIAPHHRQGDRGSGEDADDDDTKLLPQYCRFHDLIAANIATNWPQLIRVIDSEGFPEGVLLSRNIRAWLVDDVRAWLARRPTGRKKIVLPPQADGNPKARKEINA